MPGVSQRRVALPTGVSLDLLESGPSDGPALVFLHGFPELSYSWRHQLVAFAREGFHCLAPDQRGYGGSSRPAKVEDYGTDSLCADAIALLDAVKGKGSKAVFVGHDWGAWIVQDLTRLYPERCRAAVYVSVPFSNWKAPPTEVFRKLYGDKFFYIIYFNDFIGPPEREFEADPRETMRRMLWSVAGENADAAASMYPDRPAEGGTYYGKDDKTPPGLPPWCTEADLDVYAAAFRESGFFGPVSYYRNLDANYKRLLAYPPSRVTFPVFFIGGSRDPVISVRLDSVDGAHKHIPGYKGSAVIKGPGHWTQQEAPEEFNAALLGFLRGLEGDTGSKPSL
ncbi:epoxide hydrolase epha [Hyaloraphidium curvatum]|nr:epoxide hydrolase epha [Hyaloraphidium curvatum]